MTVIDRIKKPTPKKWKRFGNALIAVGGISTAGAFISDNPTIAYVLLVATAVGKFITALFTEDE